MSDLGFILVIVAALIALTAARRWAAARGRSVRSASSVTLRDLNDADGSRRLVARLESSGDLTIDGRDYGDGVERILGAREYEWVWTIAAADVPTLMQALGTTGNVIAALGDRFSGDDAADLAAFLEENDVPTQRWSRIGD